MNKNLQHSALTRFNFELNKPVISTTRIQLIPVKLSDEYRKEWNVTLNDFVSILENGHLYKKEIYRVGVLDCNVKDGYFLLIKQVEDYYSDEITKDKKQKPHLAGLWCILDKDGNEKYVAPDIMTHPYLHGGLLYSVNKKLYNIETGEFYGDSQTTMSTKKYLFLNNPYDQDHTRRGVIRVNKKTGNYKIYHE